MIAWQVMNEVALHRGSSPHLNTIDIFVDGQHLTEAVVSLCSPIPYSQPSFVFFFFHFFFFSQTESLFRLQQARQPTRCQQEDQLSTLH